MIFEHSHYEVEIRCCFNTREKAILTLPFLKENLNIKRSWISTYYGLELFRAGLVLRIGEVTRDDKVRFFMDWKGRDEGNFANIREEFGEEITSGIQDSAILKHLKCNNRAESVAEVIHELEQKGYHRFMSYSGADFSGEYEAQNMNVKLMKWPVTGYPLLVEVEHLARSREEAIDCEQSLYELCCQYRLQELLTHEEPPNMLYNQIFGTD